MLVVAFEGSGGLAPEPPADRCGLALDRCASPPGPAVAWLERGATADQSGIRHARHGSPRELEWKGAADGGSDDRGGPAQGIAYRGGGRVGGGGAGPCPGAGLRRAGGRLLAWARALPERAWAVEGAGGLGHLLSQQLVAAGEQVLDVPPKLAARVRLLASGNVNKNDPNDARSVAVAALRSPACLPVRAEDHTAVLKIWAKRHRDLSRARNQVVCRMHAVLCDQVPGGVSKRINRRPGHPAPRAGPAARRRRAARWILAEQFLADLRRIDAQRSDVKKKLATAVRASGTTVTEIFGAGPAVAAAVLGDAGDVLPLRRPGQLRRL